MAKSRLGHQREERLDKMRQLEELGIQRFPAQSKKDVSNNHVIEEFESLQGSDLTVAGRLMSLREHGKVSFGDLADQSGNIQLYIRSDLMEGTSKENQTIGFDHLKLIDPGDFVQAFGEVTKTKTGEVSILVKQLRLLTKSLRPLPNTHTEITDREFKFRRRYLDLTLNQEQRALFERKAHFWRANRDFLHSKGFIEVETPVLEHVTGGADARPFTTHMNALDQEFFLRISTELYQKRLIGGGYEKIFTIGPNFRNEGLSDEHLTEYYQTEWYWAYADYEDNMRLTEEMFRYIAQEVYGKTKFTTRGHTFDLADTWERISYPAIIKERLGIDIFESTEDEMMQVIKHHQVELSGAINRPRLIDNCWKLIRKDISGPAFLINEPAFMSPLSKSKTSDSRLTERYHAILAGSELANGYTELNNPLEQFDRFMDQQAQRDQGDDEAQMLDIDFVEMLEYGMPPTSGHGHSERVFWFFEDINAREGTLFPALKHKLEKTTQQIYGLKPISKKKDHKYLNFDESFSTEYDSASVGWAIIEGVSIEKENPDLEAEKLEVLKLLEGLSVEQLGEIPELLSYRDMYKQMKVKYQSRRPSPEALLRRIAQGKGLYTVNTLVDAYNLVVMRNKISVGAFDLESINFPTTLKIAAGGEEILLLGDDKPTEIKTGEVAYFDQEGPYNLDYNYRDAQRTAISLDTKSVWINVDGVGDITAAQVKKTLDETIEMIIKYCGGSVVDTGMLEA